MLTKTFLTKTECFDKNRTHTNTAECDWKQGKNEKFSVSTAIQTQPHCLSTNKMYFIFLKYT